MPRTTEEMLEIKLKRRSPESMSDYYNLKILELIAKLSATTKREAELSAKLREREWTVHDSIGYYQAKKRQAEKDEAKATPPKKES